MLRKSILFFMLFGLFPLAAHGAEFKVLAVMSYDEEFGWDGEIKEGIETVLSDRCEVTYFYMDTIKHPETGDKKAAEAFSLYQKLKPDGVIACDDNAQTMFVIPYLKDKVKTPVMFCGVNAEPETYGYPASNISGILERVHFRESITFLQQLVPSVKTVGYMMKNTSTAQGFFRQAKNEAKTYSEESVAFKTPDTLKEALSMAAELREQCDALFVEVLDGLLDETGKPLSESVIIPAVVGAFGKPTFCANKYTLENGALCAVIKTGQEQGETAADMLVKAMSGASVSEIPIIQNHHGKAMINITAMKALGIKPKPIALQGVELVKGKK